MFSLDSWIWCGQYFRSCGRRLLRSKEPRRRKLFLQKMTRIVEIELDVSVTAGGDTYETNHSDNPASPYVGFAWVKPKSDQSANGKRRRQRGNGSRVQEN